MEDKPLLTNTDTQGIIVKFASFISRACQIPPKPRVRTFFSSPRRYNRFVLSVLAPAVILSSMLVALLVPAVFLMDLNNPDWSWKVHNPPLNYEYIEEDFILYNRPFINVSEYPLNLKERVLNFMRDEGWRSFNLKGDETAIWKDSNVYTSSSHLITDEIVLTDNANLTLINVTFSRPVNIRVSDNASLKMINCTNIGYDNWHVISNSGQEWPSGSKGAGEYRLPKGVVEVEESATVWIEDTTLGVLTGTWYSKGGLDIRPPLSYKATIIDSSIQYVRVRCQSPIRIIDSEIHELYTDEGDFEQLGITQVTHLLPFSHRSQWFYRGRGPDIAYRSSMRVDRKEYRLGEPVNVTIRMENLGFELLTLYFNGTDRFSFRINWYNESSISDDGWIFIASYDPDHSALQQKVKIEPGEVAEFTLMWPQDPPVPPGEYIIDCGEYFATIQALSGARGYPNNRFTIADEPYHED